MLELAVLLYNAHIAAADAEIGFEDANDTLENITRRLNKWIMVDPAYVESALWACNMLNEKNKFSHPRGLTFEQFVEKILKGRGKFDTFYNIVDWSNEHGNHEPDPDESDFNNND